MFITFFNIFFVFTIPLQGSIPNGETSFIKVDQNQQVHDFANYFNDFDEESLKNSLNNFTAKSQLPVFVITYDSAEIKGISDAQLIQAHGFGSKTDFILVIILTKSIESKIVVWSYGKTIDDSTLENISYQFITQNLKSEKAIPLVDGINQALHSFEKTLSSTRKNEQKLTEPYATGYVLTYMVSFVLLALICLSFIYIHFVIKHSRKYWYISFYNIWSKWTWYMLTPAGLIIVISLYLMLKTPDVFMKITLGIVFAEFLLVEYWISPFFKPLKRVGLHLYNFSRFIHWGNHSNAQSEPSTVPSCLILNQSLTNDTLLDLTFQGLVIKNQIRLEHEWKEFRDGRSKEYLWIEKGEGYNIDGALPHEFPFLLPLQDLEAGYGYYLKQYLIHVKTHLNGPNSFKKDLISMPLAKGGYLLLWGWLKNNYSHSKRGVEEKARIFNKAISLEKDLKENMKNKTSLSFVKNISEEHLVIKGFNQCIIQIRALITNYQSEGLETAAIYPLLKPNFDLKEFIQTLQNLQDK